MKRIWVLLALIGSGSAWANPEFSQHPAATTISQCHDLDFNSYFRAQDFKKHLIRDNPDRTRPNFGGKYLLLKHELLMETLWLIADCETGKFYHETLSGLAEFKPDSLLVITTQPKSNELPRYQLWRAGDWTRLEADEAPVKPVAATVSPSPGLAPSTSPNSADASARPTATVSPPNAEQVYAGLFQKYPASPEAVCHELDFNSYFRAQSFKNNLIQLNPDRSKPNFAGHYLLLKNDVLFERFWLIADCRTGKFTREIVKGNVEFRPYSTLLLIRHSSEYAQLNLWQDERFTQLLNPARKGKQEVENELYDQDAKNLMEAAAIPKSENRVAFENLRCIGQACTIVKFPSREPQPLTPEQGRLAESVLKKWGGEFQEGTSVGYSLESAKCDRQKSSPVCKVTLSR